MISDHHEPLNLKEKLNPVLNAKVVREVKEHAKYSDKPPLHLILSKTVHAEEQYKLIRIFYETKGIVKNNHKLKATPEVIDAVLMLRAEGKSIRQIAEIMEISKSTVGRILKGVRI